MEIEVEGRDLEGSARSELNMHFSVFSYLGICCYWVSGLHGAVAVVHLT